MITQNQKRVNIPRKKAKFCAHRSTGGWSVKLSVNAPDQERIGTQGDGAPKQKGDGAKMFNDRQDVPAIEHLRTQTPSKMGPLLYPVPVIPELYTNTSNTQPKFFAYPWNKGKKNRPFGLRTGEELSRGRIGRFFARMKSVSLRLSPRCRLRVVGVGAGDDFLHSCKSGNVGHGKPLHREFAGFIFLD